MIKVAERKRRGRAGEGWEAVDATMRASPLAVPYLWLYENVASPFINPSRDKLLPD